MTGIQPATFPRYSQPACISGSASTISVTAIRHHHRQREPGALEQEPLQPLRLARRVAVATAGEEHPVQRLVRRCTPEMIAPPAPTPHHRAPEKTYR